jgi:hypothetical protein
MTDWAAKRVEFLRQARAAEAGGGPALGNLYRLLATNCNLMASGDQAIIARITPKYETNLRRLNEALAARDAQS